MSAEPTMSPRAGRRRPAVLLDRDGVLNDLVYDPDHGTADSPFRPDDLVLRPGVPAAIRAINEQGWPVVVVTNQPGVAKGKATASAIDLVHEAIRTRIRAESGAHIDAFYYCPHHPAGTVRKYTTTCRCRKPGTGLLEAAARELDLDLRRSVVVGDGIVDIEAGAAVNARTTFIGGLTPFVAHELVSRDLWPDYVAPGLPEAIEHWRRSMLTNARPQRGHVTSYLHHAAATIAALDHAAISAVADEIRSVKARKTRLFIIGNGGGAAHASHAVNDFRKLAGIECYTPADNMAELTARINDDGWDAAYSDWLLASRMTTGDLLLVISVGGGDEERGLSRNIISAIETARRVGARVCGVVGPLGGSTWAQADACVRVPATDRHLVTMHTEGTQSVLLHLLASHPGIAERSATWESRGSVHEPGVR